MYLEEIFPRPNIVVTFEGCTAMCSIIAKDSTICFINSKGSCTKWEGASLAEFCKNMFLDPNKIIKVIDWNLEENIIYRRIELTKKELSEKIGIASHNWIYKE